MPENLDQYTIKSANWRETIRRNNRRTYIVIFIFFLIYTGIGLLIDMSMYSSTAPDNTISQLFKALITFHFIPYATIILFFIAGISLWVSYRLHDQMMLLGTEYHEITPQTAKSEQEIQLYNVVEEIKIAAGLRYMPKVYMIEADYMNAFASGYSEKSAMVAITRGLMTKLNREELQAVMAHEVSHIRHLDIKLTLTASLLANITLMVLDICFYKAIFVQDNENMGSRNTRAFITILIILRYVLPLINILLLLYLSRKRELMADAGCVELTRANQPLANALIKINDDYTANREQYSEDVKQIPHENVRREAYIFDPIQAGIEDVSSISDFFSTHPSLAVRLAALGFTPKNKHDK